MSPGEGWGASVAAGGREKDEADIQVRRRGPWQSRLIVSAEGVVWQRA